MSSLTTAGEQQRLRLNARLIGLAGLALPLLVWIGWWLRIETLVRISDNWVVMTPWTAVLSAFLALAVLLQSLQQSTRMVRLLGLGLLVLIALFASEYVAGVDVGLDRLFFSDQLSVLQQDFPGRPSPQTLSITTLIALALLVEPLHGPGRRRARGVLLLISLVTTLVMLLAYVFHDPALTGISTSTGLALPTGLTLLAVSLSALLSRPELWPMAWLLQLRLRHQFMHLLLTLAGVPITLELIRHLVFSFGGGQQTGLLLGVVAAMALMLVGILRTSLSEE